MEVIFLDNVKGVGRKGEVKNVSDGYFLNFLAPKKLAARATSEVIKQVQLKKQKEVMDKERLVEEAQLAKDKLDGLVIEMKGKANGTTLYAAISLNDVISAIVDKVKIRLSKNNLPANLHIKEIGEHKIDVKLASGLKAVITVKIIEQP